MFEIIIFSLIGIGLAVFIVFTVISVLKYQHVVIVKDITGSGQIVQVMKAKSFTDNKKKDWWVLREEKDNIKKFQPVPPSSAIQINSKGKKVATLYRDESGNMCWGVDDTKTLGDITILKPLNSSQREVLVNKIREAEERKSKKGWKENIVHLASLGALVILVVSVLVFYGEIAKPVIASHELRVQELEVYNQMLENLKGLEQKVEGLQQVQNNNVGGVSPPSEE